MLQTYNHALPQKREKLLGYLLTFYTNPLSPCSSTLKKKTPIFFIQQAIIVVLEEREPRHLWLLGLRLKHLVSDEMAHLKQNRLPSLFNYKSLWSSDTFPVRAFSIEFAYEILGTFFNEELIGYVLDVMLVHLNMVIQGFSVQFHFG